MGEVLKVPKYEAEEKKEEKKLEGMLKTVEKERMQAQVVELIKQGYSHKRIYKALRALGYTFREVDDFLATADIIIHKETRKPLPWKSVLLAGAVALVVLAALSAIAVGIIGGPVDCGEDVFCVKKISRCESGSYISSYLGTTKSFSIAKVPEGCKVRVVVEESPGGKELPGMEMHCLYPVEHGLTQISYEHCTGSLADAWKSDV